MTREELRLACLERAEVLLASGARGEIQWVALAGAVGCLHRLEESGGPAAPHRLVAEVGAALPTGAQGVLASQLEGLVRRAEAESLSDPSDSTPTLVAAERVSILQDADELLSAAVGTQLSSGMAVPTASLASALRVSRHVTSLLQEEALGLLLEFARAECARGPGSCGVGRFLWTPVLDRDPLVRAALLSELARRKTPAPRQVSAGNRPPEE